MSPRKIIFLVIVGIIGLLMIYGVWNLSQETQKKKEEKIASISVWVVGDTSEQYQDLFSEFSKTNEIYKNTTIDIRVFPDYEKYQRILLSTLSEGNGPDIFMVEGGGDAILESKIIPIPDSIIPLSDFDRKYEDIFLPLIITEGEGDTSTRSLLGVPLGYETLGIFYHKSLVRAIPKTWSEIETLELSNDANITFPINIGLGPIYTPYATDILAYFIGKDGLSRSTKTLQAGSRGIEEYLTYGNTSYGSIANEGGEISAGATLREARTSMDDGLLSTIDLFMRGRIAMVIGYPSLIRDIEKAGKRAGDELLDDLILTERLPQDSLGKDTMNIARYRFLGLSKKSENPQAGADLLAYLMSDTGMTRAQSAFPLLISPERSRAEVQKSTSLSQVFARTRLDAFIPGLGDDIFLYNYQIKGEYERIFREYLDRNDKIDINNMVTRIGKNISCELESTLSGVISESCINEVTP